MESVFFDSSVFLDYFLLGPKMEKSRKMIHAIASKEMNAVINTICIMEIKYRMIEKRSHDKAEEAIFLIKNMENLNIIGINDQIAERAADLRFKYYDKKEKPMSFADALHIATAIESKCSKIITTDSDFKDIEEISAEVY